MFKRFHDAEKWDRPWYRKLSPVHKCFLDYILSKCDNVGVWIPDFETAEFYIGGNVNPEDFISKTNENIVILDNGYWWIKDFCAFQYGELSELSRPHQSYIKLLEKHGLIEYVAIVGRSTTPKSVRSRMTAKIKDEIYLRDNGICQYCGQDVSLPDRVIDHFIPISKGGSGGYENLVLSCKHCNAIKSDFTPDEFISRHPEYSTAVNRVSKKLDTVLRVFDTLKDKDQDIDIDKDMDIGKDKDCRKKAFFVKPSLDEVQAYCDERANGIKAHAFIDYYDSVGWMVGKKPMRDWKACIRTWESKARPADTADLSKLNV